MRIAIGLFLFLSIASNPISAQYVYLSPNGSCSMDGTGCMNYFSEFYVFIQAGDVTNSTGTSFFVEGDEFTTFGPENILSVDSHDGVLIESGDLFSGIVLSWSEGTYVSDTLLTVVLDPENMPLFNWMLFTKNIQLSRASGDPLLLDDFMFYCSHCTGMAGGTIWWQHADTISAAIGQQTTLDLPCIGESGGGLSGTHLEAHDELGWVDECVHCSVSIICGPCPWNITHVLVSISIPEGVAEGTTSKMRMLPTGPCCFDDSTSVYIKALDVSGTEERSWGSIKKLIGND